MNRKYPKISKNLHFRRTGTNTVEIVDILSEKKWSLNVEAARFVHKLDGKTNPYTIPSRFSKEQIDVLLRELSKRGMFQKSNILRLPKGTFFIPLWEPKMTNALRLTGFFWNVAISALCLPLLLIGLLTFLLHFWEFKFTGAIGGLPLGLIPGIILYEISRVFAAAALGADVRQMGVTLQYFVLPGFYTVIDDKEVQNRLHRIRIHAAGVETDLFLAGLFLILGAFLPNAGGMFLLAAALNGFLALMHLMLLPNSDGAAILSEILGTENIIAKAQEIVRNKEMRTALMAKGIHGAVGIGISYVLFGLQIIFPILLILNILEVIAWIV